MKKTANSDEGEYNITSMFRIITFFVIFISLFNFACNEKKKEVITGRSVVDSTFIKQQKANPIAKANTRRKKIYLTFDDGPNKGTMNVLRAVEEENIPVTFFIVGKHVNDKPEQKVVWDSLKANSSIERCNHSYSHALNHYSRYYNQPGIVIQDIQQNQQELGFDNNIIRMPGRNAWRIDTINHTDIKESKAAIDSVYQAGYAIMGWDVEWMFDHKTLSLTTDVDLLLRRIHNLLETNKTKVPGNIVVLAHDQAFQKEVDIEKLHYFFLQLKNKPDYDLLLVSEYPGIKKDLP